MPDTTFIYNTLVDSLDLSVIDSVEGAFKIHEAEREYLETKQDGDVTALIIVIILILSIIFLYLSATSKKFNDFLRWILYTPQTYNPIPQPVQNVTRGGYIYSGKTLGLSHNDIVNILNKRFPYYKNLSVVLQYRFINRLKEFINSKTFIIHSNHPYKEMPVLLSATAIQITFGLDKYLLPNYKYIQIYEAEYFANDASLRVLAGHVVGNTITVAWNHYLKGYELQNDGVNVGLHEMAHALYYQNLIANVFKSRDFKFQFNEIMEEGSEILENKYIGKDIFSPNAFKNLQELWAESVELFFEKPLLFKQTYPDLFEDVQLLLKQNPFNKSMPVEL